MDSQSKEQERTVRIDLTDDQRTQIKDRVGLDATTLEFSVRELEGRIVPLPMESLS
jgi:hypothetical protein